MIFSFTLSNTIIILTSKPYREDLREEIYIENTVSQFPLVPKKKKKKKEGREGGENKKENY